jgi:hypothetical protein
MAVILFDMFGFEKAGGFFYRRDRGSEGYVSNLSRVLLNAKLEVEPGVWFR